MIFRTFPPKNKWFSVRFPTKNGDFPYVFSLCFSLPRRGRWWIPVQTAPPWAAKVPHEAPGRKTVNVCQGVNLHVPMVFLGFSYDFNHKLIIFTTVLPIPTPGEKENPTSLGRDPASSGCDPLALWQGLLWGHRDTSAMIQLVLLGWKENPGFFFVNQLVKWFLKQKKHRFVYHHNHLIYWRNLVAWA